MDKILKDSKIIKIDGGGKSVKKKKKNIRDEVKKFIQKYKFPLNNIKEYYDNDNNKRIKEGLKNILKLKKQVNNDLKKQYTQINPNQLTRYKKEIRIYIGYYFDDRVTDIDKQFDDIKNGIPIQEKQELTEKINNVKEDIKKFKGQEGGGFLQKGGDGINNIEDGLEKLEKLINEFIKRINELKGRDVSGELKEFDDEIKDDNVEKTKAKVMDFFSFESPCSWNDYLKCYKQNPKIINDILTDTYTYFGKTIN